MKALDFLANEKAHPAKAYVLQGEDPTLKNLVLQVILANQEEKLDVERMEIKSVPDSDLIPTMMEGSLFGNRVLLVDLLSKKWGKIPDLLAGIREAVGNGDVVVIKSEDFPQELKSPLVLEIECPVITHKKTREKLIKLRAENYKIEFTDEGLKSLVERTDNLAEVENALKSLKYALHEKHRVTQLDVEKATGEPPQRKDILRALLTVNRGRLVKEVNEGDPVLVLSIMHAALLKLFVFIEMSEEKNEEDKLEDVLKIHKRALKDWKTAKKKYASRAIRRLLEVVTQSYENVISGRNKGWQENLEMQIRKLK